MTDRSEAGGVPVVPRPAASVLLIRPGAVAGVQVYMIRRSRQMRFLGGYYAFPGGRVDPADATAEMLARCRGLDGAGAERVIPTLDSLPSFAYWVTAARELLEEVGVLLACDEHGRAVEGNRPEIARRIERARDRLMGAEAPLHALLAAEGWYLDLDRVRYLSHFIPPPSSPIRFTARFFLAPMPSGQEPRLLTGETSEGFWMDPPEGVRRYETGDMLMAEPAESALRYLADFAGMGDLWEAHADGHHKFHGLFDRPDVMRERARRPGAPPDRG